MNAHPAGPRHADEVHHGGPPTGPAAPPTCSSWPRMCGRTTLFAATTVWSRSPVFPVTDIAAEFGTPVFVIDEDDFRARCREIAAAFGGGENVRYAAKAFLCTEIARWIDEEGLSLDVCSGGELAVALHAGFPAERIALHGNNKSVDELTAAVKAGVGHVVLDSMTEIDRLDEIAGDAGVVQDVLVRVTVGVEAHTHEFISTAHEDQKFGLSLASGAAMAAVRRVFETDHLRLVGLHSHIGSQIFDVAGFELAAHRVIGLLRDVVAEFGVDKTSQISIVDLGGGLGISYLPQDDPPPGGRPGRQARRDRAQRVGRRRAARAEAGGRAGSRHRRPGHHHALRGRHRQGRRRQPDRAPSLRQRRRRDERQHPDVAVRRRVRRAAGLAGQRRRPDAGPCRRKALRERRHRRARRLGARRRRPGRPAGRRRHRRILLFDVEPLQPDRPPGRGGRARRAGPPDPAPGDGRRSVESGSEDGR